MATLGGKVSLSIGDAGTGTHYGPTDYHGAVGCHLCPYDSGPVSPRMQARTWPVTAGYAIGRVIEKGRPDPARGIPSWFACPPSEETTP